MLDVILDCFGALLLIGQAAWFLAKGRIEALPTDAGAGLAPRNPEQGNRRMFDLAMIALSCASFAILILYTYACDRM